VVADLAEIFPAHAEQRRAVEFGVAADLVVGVRVELVAIAVTPHLFRLVLALDVDGARIPVVLLARHVVAALEHENALAARASFQASVPPPAPLPMMITS
jgi:hypothetical protein